MIELSSRQLQTLFPQAVDLPEFTCKGVETDSRADCGGQLFVALRGEHFDGHEFVAKAKEKGAVAAVVETKCDVEIPQILVDDCLHAMAALALYWRQTVKPMLAAITGSNGKTTVKEMLGQILSRYHPTLVTAGNLNNNIGVPKTLFRLQRAHRYAVIEMGANHAGEIKDLVSMADPDVVYVNNARAAHVEGFGSLQGVVEAKGEMYQYSSAHALAVINDDEDAADYWRSIAASQRSQCFSLQHACDVTSTFSQNDQGLRIEFTYRGAQAVSEIQLYGAHNAQNATAAVTLALACGLDLNQAVAGLNGFSGVAGRQQFIAGVNHSVLIDDSYNANPDSLRAAVEVLCALPGKAWLALGDMGELGDDAEQLHHEAVAQAFSNGVEQVFALGEMSCNAVAQYAPRGHCFANHAAMAEYLLPRLGKGINLLIKGSRSARMEKLVTALRANDPTAEARHAV